MMPRTLFKCLTAGLAAALLGTGCATDRATAPNDPAVAATKNATLDSASLYTPIVTAPGTTVPVVQRLQPLAADLSVSQTITSAGGILQIPSAGLAVVFAPGAVQDSLRVTATANAGSGVVYSFEPHGTVFNAPVYVVQDMGLTTMASDTTLASTIAGAYMPDGLADLNLTGSAAVSEIHRASVGTKHAAAHGGLILDHAVFVIQHFSGYILTGGRQQEDAQ